MRGMTTSVFGESAITFRCAELPMIMLTASSFSLISSDFSGER